MKKATLILARLLKGKRSYTTAELALELNVHPRTIHSWIQMGLEPVDRDRRPFLFMGLVVKKFVNSKASRSISTLTERQLYCLKCRTGGEVSVESLSIQYVSTRRVSKSVHLVSGNCPNCGGQSNRFMTLENAFLQFPSLKNEGSEIGLRHDSLNPLNTIMEVVREIKYGRQ